MLPDRAADGRRADKGDCGRRRTEILATGTRRSYSFLARPGGGPFGSHGGFSVHARQLAFIHRLCHRRRSEPGRSGVRSSAADAGTAGPEIAVRALHRTDSDLQEWSRHVLPADFFERQGSPGVFRSGLSDDVFVRQGGGGALVSRVVEARSGLRDLLLGRSVGVGLVPERTDDRGRGAHAYEAMQKAVGLKARADPKERALIEAMSVRYVQSFDATKRVEQDRAYKDAMSRSRQPIRTISTSRRSTPTRCSCSSRAAARAMSTIRRSASASCARGDPDEERPSPWRLPPLRPCHRIDRGPGKGRRLR